jgi:very-short-patch-repair endonuclease
MLAAPDPVDPFRTSVRAALMACPLAVASGITAARIHELWGLRLWTPADIPELLIAAGLTHVQRRGMRRRSGLHAEETTVVAGFPVTTLERTVHDLAVRLPFDDLVCLVDSALKKGCRLPTEDRRRRSLLNIAAGLADARSESPLETRLRLLLTRAGLAPETLQHKVVEEDGYVVARLDMAWPTLRLGIEADGRDVHENPEAVLHDRRRQNDLQALRWTLLRFTWDDVVNHPAMVIAKVRWTLENLETAANLPG